MATRERVASTDCSSNIDDNTDPTFSLQILISEYIESNLIFPRGNPPPLNSDVGVFILQAFLEINPKYR